MMRIIQICRSFAALLLFGIAAICFESTHIFCEKLTNDEIDNTGMIYQQSYDMLLPENNADNHTAGGLGKQKTMIRKSKLQQRRRLMDNVEYKWLMIQAGCTALGGFLGGFFAAPFNALLGGAARTGLMSGGLFNNLLLGLIGALSGLIGTLTEAGVVAGLAGRKRLLLALTSGIGFLVSLVGGILLLN